MDWVCFLVGGVTKFKDLLIYTKGDKTKIFVEPEFEEATKTSSESFPWC